MTSHLSLGVDLGGTKMALAVVDSDGQIVRESRLPTQPQDGPDLLISRLAEAIRALIADVDQPIAGVGIGVPGAVGRPASVAGSVCGLQKRLAD